MRLRSMKRVAVVALAFVAMGMAACSSAVGDEPKPPAAQAPLPEPGKSSPPDLTPYARPVIPEDATKAPSPPTPRPTREMVPVPGQGPTPQPPLPPNLR